MVLCCDPLAIALTAAAAARISVPKGKVGGVDLREWASFENDEERWPRQPPPLADEEASLAVVVAQPLRDRPP